VIRLRPRFQACALVPSRGGGHVLRVVATAWTASSVRARADRSTTPGPIAIFDRLTHTWIA
jgi:hypothetical protein